MYLSEYRITSGYGNRPQFGDFHAGVDFATPIGTPLPALIDGVIQFEGYIPAAVSGYPKELICVLQADGYFTVYGHLSQTMVNAGQRVKAGDIIAKSGNSGYTTGPHLHIERRAGTKASNNGLSAYPSQDITPLLHAYGQAQGGAEDMTLDQVFDYCFITQANRWPNDQERKWWKDSGLEPYTWVQRHAHFPVKEERDALQRRVDELLTQSETMTISIDKLEARLTAAENRATAAEQHLKDADKALADQGKVIEDQESTIGEMTKTINRQKDEMTMAAEAIEKYKEAVENSDVINALSPLELIRIAINRWLKGGA